MKNAIRPTGATILFLLTLLFSLCFASSGRAQVLLEENFDAAALGTPPPGWSQTGNGNVDPGQACSGNAFRMNQFSGAINNNLDTPDLLRGTTPGNVAVSFDLRIADWNDNSGLTGSGQVYAQLHVDGAFVEDFVSIVPATYTPGCETQTASFSTADIPLGSTFEIRFLGLWSSGDWSYVIDNVSIRVVNDECTDAVLLSQTTQPAGILDGNVVDGSFEGATQSQTGCTGTANDDVWYQFVATKRSVSVSVQAGDVVWELFSGSCGSLTSLKCSDNSALNEFDDYYGTNIGETYYVRVYSFASTPLTGTDADFRIQIGTPKSVNDECAAATILAQSAATSCGTNLMIGSVEDATETQAACTGNANDDVWYQFEATSTDFSVYLESGDFVMELFEGNCGSLTPLICRDQYPIDETFNYSSATIGNTYYLRVHSFGSTALTGTAAEFGICVFTSPTAPVNDACSNPTNLTVSVDPVCGGVTSGTTNGSTVFEPNATTPRCTAINGQESVWYSFTARATEQIITMSNVNILNGNSNDISSFEVFSGSCGALTRVQCSGQRFGSDPGSVTVSGLTIDEDYLLRVITVNGFHSIDFDICITTPCPDPATNLTVTNITSTTATLSHNYVLLGERTSVVTTVGGDPVNDQVFAENTLQSPVSATGLTPNTNYEYYVLSCGGTVSAGPVAFTTCPALATGLSVDMITGTTARLNIAADAISTNRDFIVVPTGQVPVFGGGGTFFSTSSADVIGASGLSSNTTYDFYVGQACPETFAGPVTFTTRPSCGDVIYDTGGPSGNYGNNENYVVTVCPETADQSGGARRVSITFDEFDIEDGFDGIEIFDGPDTSSPVLTSPGSGTNLWSWERIGDVGTGDLEGVTVFTFNASGCITLRFTSDVTVTFPGFKATVNCDLSGDIISEILTTVPSGSGAVTADKAYLSTGSGFMYYVKEGIGSLLALKLGNTQAQVPTNGVTMAAGTGATNLGMNGCDAPYVTVPDWWVMNRTWDVAPSANPASPVDIRYFYTQEDFDALATGSGFAGLSHEDLSYFKINGGDEEDLTVAGNNCHEMVSPENYQEFDTGEYVYTDQTGSPSGSTAHQAEFTITSFSGGGGGAGTNFGGALPLILLSFDGEVRAKINRLEWVSSQEANTDFHQVARSADGRNWEVIGELAAAGDSEIVTTYEFIDEAPLPHAFYRIVTFDFDGSSSTSSMVELTRNDLGKTLNIGQISPQPANDQVNVELISAKEQASVDLRLYDAAGREVRHLKPNLIEGWNIVNLEIEGLPVGLYWLRATDDAGSQVAKPLVKR